MGRRRAQRCGPQTKLNSVVRYSCITVRYNVLRAAIHEALIAFARYRAIVPFVSELTGSVHRIVLRNFRPSSRLTMRWPFRRVPGPTAQLRRILCSALITEGKSELLGNTSLLQNSVGCMAG